jgi:hypothetical protein
MPQETPGGVAKIASGIAGIMGEIGVVGKDGKNQFHNYKYAKMDDILQKLTPLMAKHGIVIMQTELDREMFDEGKAVGVRYAFTILHSSGEVWPDRPIQTGLAGCRHKNGGFDDKALNKCHTAARKYFLMALFQIPTGDEDADADAPPEPQHAKLPPPPSLPDGRIAPHFISGKIVGQDLPHTWESVYIPFIEKAQNVAEIEQWELKNTKLIGELHAMKPNDIYRRIEAATNKRKTELGAPPAGKPTQAKKPPAPVDMVAAAQEAGADFDPETGEITDGVVWEDGAPGHE